MTGNVRGKLLRVGRSLAAILFVASLLQAGTCFADEEYGVTNSHAYFYSTTNGSVVYFGSANEAKRAVAMCKSGVPLYVYGGPQKCTCFDAQQSPQFFEKPEYAQVNISCPDKLKKPPYDPEPVLLFTTEPHSNPWHKVILTPELERQVKEFVAKNSRDEDGNQMTLGDFAKYKAVSKTGSAATTVLVPLREEPADPESGCNARIPYLAVGVDAGRMQGYRVVSNVKQFLDLDGDEVPEVESNQGCPGGGGEVDWLKNPSIHVNFTGGG